MKKEDGKSSDGKIKTHLLTDNITWRAYYVLNPSILSEGKTEEEAIINLKYGKWIKTPAMNTLEKEFVPYQESLELKELGFDEPCFGWYASDKSFYTDNKITINSGLLLAPLKQQAFRWFREKHGWVAEIHGSPQHDHFYANLLLQAKGEVGNSKICDTYEEAELSCLRKLIEIVKSNKS